MHTGAPPPRPRPAPSQPFPHPLATVWTAQRATPRPGALVTQQRLSDNRVTRPFLSHPPCRVAPGLLGWTPTPTEATAPPPHSGGRAGPAAPWQAEVDAPGDTTFDVRGVNTSAGLTSAPMGEGDQFSFSPCRSLTHPGKGLILSDPLPASSRPQPKAPAHPVGAGIHIFHQAGQGVRPAGRPRASSCAQLGATSGLLGLEAWLGDGGPACSLLPGHSPRRPAGALPVGACAVSTAGV